jgi:hypothetical protein
MQQAQQQGVGLPGFLQGGIGDSQGPNDLAQHHDPNNWGPIWAGLRTTLTALLLPSLFGLAVGLSAINVGATAQGSVAAGRPSNQGRRYHADEGGA